MINCPLKGGSLTGKSYGWVVLVLLGVLAGVGLLWQGSSDPQEDEVLPVETESLPSDPGEEGVLVTLFFPRADLSGLVRETISVPDRRDSLSEWVRLLLSHLGKEAPGERVAVFPGQTHLRHVFADDQGGLFLDFSSELERRSPVGVQMESLALRALIRTLKEDLPGYSSVSLLVDGRERETLWGHVYTRKPFAFDRFE